MLESNPMHADPPYMLGQAHADHREDVAGAAPAKFLTFMIGCDEFAVAIADVREVIGLRQCTPVPDMPSYMRGVLNLRGAVVPVLDLREKLGVDTARDTEDTCIAVLVSEGAPVGAIVDRVVEVVEVDLSLVTGGTDIGGRPTPAWVLGIEATRDGVRFLVDVDGLVTSSEMDGFPLGPVP